ncbi:MAG: hypothetical protein Kow0097_13730 [Candidatus Bipolaricaulota bacterium]
MRLFAVLAAVVCIVASPGHTANDTTSSALDLAELTRGRWALFFVVLPGCPACEHAIAWLGAVYHAHPQIRFLLVSPWTNAELEAASSQLDLPLAVDEGGRRGATWGVRRAPSLVFLLDGRPHARLDWPFPKAELRRGLEELAAAPQEGPWQFLGAAVPLGLGRTLDGEPADLDALPRPLLLVFFNPDCPPCWDALPGLIELSEKILPVIVVLAHHALSADGRERMSEAGLLVLYDGERDLVRTFAVRATPTYVILHREGVIRWVHEGMVGPEEFGRAVLAVAGEGGTAE